ncbi:MAG: OmpW family protein [Gammaproteobacteria bacterium]|nr:MAG: OmpW family protein [Gammaproteobacteria bacterium]
MNLRKGNLLAGILMAATAAPAMANDAGDLLVRVRGLYISPNDDSTTVRAAGTPVAGSGVGVDEDVIPELDLTYMFTKHIGAELILGTSEHNVNPEGTLPGVLGSSADIIDAKVLPPTLTLQYHFFPEGAFRPYVGVGINYTLFYDEEATGGMAGSSVDLNNSWGWAVQGGFDFTLKDNWFVNVDVKYIDIDTTASFSSSSPVGVPVAVDVDIDPIVVGAGIGYRFDF